ncbi:riboflavin biosynthesis protein PYRD, chloroplastic-like [Silene latifolia]|uniref:riboflavin biosynthesis protein PYRD, chloroplastic-like n=1 Tax=Silene latifolia TaxID=37657 RepID=UPI003D77EC11
MNSLNLSHSTHGLTPDFPQLIHIKFSSVCNSISGLFNSPKWVPNSHKKLSTFGKNSFGSKFNLGFSYECCNLGNFVDLVRAMSVEGFESSENVDDGYYMRKSLELARNALGCTSPNPMVGCVIVKDGKIVGQGFHPKAGMPHAEVFALREAGELAENATAYVTLEPCNHHGRTPPCSEALIKAKVKKVVVGMVDPNPIVSSRGIDKLREAGIEVVVGVEEESCKKLNEAFIHRMLYGKPFVTLRYSISMNGEYSEQLGESVSNLGGYYSKLLQEYDAVIHSLTSMTQQWSFFSSQESNARQPQHIFIAKNHDALSPVSNLPIEGDFMPIVFADKELPLEPQISHQGIEIVVLDHISLDVILDYCSKQGFCNVLIDLKGKFDGLGEILVEGLEANLLQKVVVEILPYWVENGVGSPLADMILTHRKSLKNLSTRISGNSVVLEGYF